MSTVVKCSATTKKGTKCSYKAKNGAFCGRHCPKDQVIPVAKKIKVSKAPKRSLPKLNTANANQLLEENNILLRAIADKIGLNVEVLCPINKKYSPTYDDKTSNWKRRERMRNSFILLNWDKKTKEVKEITPEVLVEKENEGVEMVAPEIMATWAKKEREIEEEEKEIKVEEDPWDTWVKKENEGVEMVTPEIMSYWAKKEREIEEEEKEIKVEKFKPSIKKETLIEPSIIQSPVEEKKQSINKINKLKKPNKSFFQCQYNPFVDMPCKKLVCNPGDKYCKEHLHPKCIQGSLTGKACNKPTNIPGEAYCNEHREEKFVISEIITKDQIIKHNLNKKVCGY